VRRISYISHIHSQTREVAAEDARLEPIKENHRHVPAGLLNRQVLLSSLFPTVQTSTADQVTSEKSVARPFRFMNLGILAYTGNNNALAQLEVPTKLELKGWLGWLGWRSVYLSKQVSSRNMAMVFFDWFKTGIFGRDLSRL
jgi:NADH dehydrogenase FAD-containing subunit